MGQSILWPDLFTSMLHCLKCEIWRQCNYYSFQVQIQKRNCMEQYFFIFFLSIFGIFEFSAHRKDSTYRFRETSWWTEVMPWEERMGSQGSRYSESHWDGITSESQWVQGLQPWEVKPVPTVGFFERFCRFLWTVVVGLCLNPTFSNHDCLDTWWKTYLQPSGKIQVWPFRRGRLWPSLCGLHVSDLVHRPVEAMKGATSLCFFRAQFSWQRNTFILCVLNQLSQQISIQWWVKDDNKNLWTSQTWTFIL